MKKFLLAEIVIAAIYAGVFLPCGNWLEYVGNVIGTMLLPLGIGYLIAVCHTRKSPRIHKVAFVVFCVIMSIVSFQLIYERNLRQEQAQTSNTETTTAPTDKADSPVEKDKQDDQNEEAQTRAIVAKAVQMVQESLAVKQDNTNKKSKFFTDISFKTKIKIEKCLEENIYSSECLDACSGLDRNSAACIEYDKKFWAREYEIHKDYYDNLEKWRSEEIAREKFYTVLIWLGGCLFFIFILYILFRLVKNKISLRIKRRAGKHTLDDVFAAEKKD
ncbi:MAG: sulfite exporter TauE/SafE family protein [Elusimicrobiaceae bacterium]|nr:sulfite exporter TauE/SafE family protein [Elusimicrobiaceae bacterium]